MFHHNVTQQKVEKCADTRDQVNKNFMGDDHIVSCMLLHSDSMELRPVHRHDEYVSWHNHFEQEVSEAFDKLGRVCPVAINTQDELQGGH